MLEDPGPAAHAQAQALFRAGARGRRDALLDLLAGIGTHLRNLQYQVMAALRRPHGDAVIADAHLIAHGQEGGLDRLVVVTYPGGHRRLDHETAGARRHHRGMVQGHAQVREVQVLVRGPPDGEMVALEPSVLVGDDASTLPNDGA